MEPPAKRLSPGGEDGSDVVLILGQEQIHIDEATAMSFGSIKDALEASSGERSSCAPPSLPPPSLIFPSTLGRRVVLPFDKRPIQTLLELQMQSMSDPESVRRDLAQLSVEERFELVGPVLYLDTPTLQQAVCGSVAASLDQCTTVSELCEALRTTSDLSPEEQAAALSELLCAPASPVAAAASQPAVSRAVSMSTSEDGLIACLEQCAIPTLRLLKAISRRWASRARLVLASEAWCAQQQEVDLEWLLAAGAEPWADVAALGRVLPLALLHGFGFAVDLEALKRAETLDLPRIKAAATGTGNPPEELLLASAILTCGGASAATSLKLDGEELPVKQLSGVDPVESIDLTGKGLRFNSAVVIASLLTLNTTTKSLK